MKLKDVKIKNQGETTLNALRNHQKSQHHLLLMESQLINSCIWKVEPQDRHCIFCILEHCKDRIPRYKRNGTVLPTLRNMNVNEEISLSAEDYNAARTAASVAKSTWGSEFTVRKIGLKVYIKRLS